MIKATGLTKTFGNFKALDNVTCTIPSGCIYGLVGSNGAGKSTLLRLLTGVYKADAGTITVDDEAVFENPAAKGKLVFVSDELYFLPGASLFRMAKLYEAVYASFDRVRFKKLTETFGLNPRKAVNTFSKGMKRQAAILLALSCHPQYLLLDETFDGLDPVMRHLVRQLLCEDVAQRQATVVLTSHSLRELQDICDQLALLHRGGLVLESDVQNLKTTLFKVQVAFEDEYDRSRFDNMALLQFQKRGTVSEMIVRGDCNQTTQQLRAMNPLLLDVLPLTLEEVFTYEMDALGYAFKNEQGGETA